MKKTLLNEYLKPTSLASLLFLFSFMFSINLYATTNCGNITRFEFSNGNSSTTITNNGSYVISELPNNFYIDVIVNGFSESSSIRIKNLNTGAEVTIVENYLPYTFPAGNNAWSYGAGTYEIKSKLFKYNYSQGSACDTDTLRFTLTNAPSCGKIDGFEFYNGTDASVPIVNGGSYDITNIPSNFNINIPVSGMTESAFSTLTNLDTGEVFTRLENVLPYTYPGATNQVWTHGCGTFKICSSVYKYDNNKGKECDSACIIFTLTCKEPCGSITEFQFANNGVNEPTIIEDGGVYDVNDLPTDFYINGIVVGDSESFRYTVTNTDTGEVFSIIENYIDYTFPAGNAPWFLGVGTFEVKGEIFTGNYCRATKCDEQIITFTISDGPDEAICELNAVTTVVDNTVFVLFPNEPVPVVTIIPEDDTVVDEADEDGFRYACLLSKGINKTIRFYERGLSIDLVQPGNFNVHLLIYNEDTLDLDSIVLGQTTIDDVMNTINANDTCASLDAVGVSITIINGGADERASIAVGEPVKDFPVDVNNKVGELINSNLDIKLYPNPAVNDFNVELFLLDTEVMNYDMYDLNGRQVLSGTFDNSALGKTKVDTKALSAGLYILKFESNFRSFSKKIQINK